MTDRHTTLMRADSDPPTPRPRAPRPCWQHVLAGGVLLGLFVMTIRAAVHELGAPGVWATIAFWVLMGTPAAIEWYDRAHGSLPPPPRSDKWR